MKVSFKQLEAIIKLLFTAAQLGQLDNRESENLIRFLQEFKLDHDKMKELLCSAGGYQGYVLYKLWNFQCIHCKVAV